MTLTRFSCWPEFDHHWFPSPLADGSLLSDAMRNGKKRGGICLICEFKEAFFQCTYLYIKLHFFGNALSNYVTIYSIYFKYNMIFNAMTFLFYANYRVTTSPWPHDLYVSAVAEVLVWTDLKLLTPVAYYFFVILKQSKENLQHGKNYYIHCLVHQSFDNFTIIQSRSTLMFISITLHILLRKNMRYQFLIRKEKNVHKYNHGQ